MPASNHRRAGRAGLLLVAAASTAGAQPAVSSPAAMSPGWTWAATVGIAHRQLVERDANGARLLTESGPMAQLQLATGLKLAGGGALCATAGLAGGDLDYAGQTQAGAPLDTHTRHTDLWFALAWNPRALNDLWFGVRALQQRRDIESVGAIQGLDETSRLLMAEVKASHAFARAGWSWEPWVAVRASFRHDLQVDYGGLFDTSNLQGGSRRELELGIAATPAGSPWHWQLAWTGTRQSASATVTVTRGGVPVGTVHQPQIDIDDFALQVRREF